MYKMLKNREKTLDEPLQYCYNEFTEMSQKCHKMNEKENEKT